MWRELFNENEHFSDMTHHTHQKEKKDADGVDNDAVKATGIRIR